MSITKLLGGEWPKGALFMCLAEFPQFKADFDILYQHGHVKVISDMTLEWTKSQTSLAEYFKWIGAPHPVTNGFWGPVSKCFGVDRRALSKAASPNGNALKPDYSKDFLKLKKILEEHRAGIQATQKELRLFRQIKRLVAEAGNEEPEKIHDILPKIAALFSKNVDKNVQKRRWKISEVLSISIYTRDRKDLPTNTAIWTCFYVLFTYKMANVIVLEYTYLSP